MKYAAAVDLGGTNTSIALVNEKLEIESKRSFPTQAKKGKSFVLENTAKKTLLFLEKHKKKEIFGIGIGFAGVPKKDFVELNLLKNKTWDNIALKEFFEKKTGLKVFADNDARAFALAEKLKGIGLKHRSFLALTLGTGIGSCLVLDSIIQEHPSAIKDEIGHTAVNASRNHSDCVCGKLCIESMASARAISEKAASLKQKLEIRLPESPEMLDALAEKGNFYANALLSEAGAFLGQGIAKLHKKYCFEVVVVSGGLSNSRTYLEAARKELERIVEKKCPLLKSAMQNPSLIGAAAAVLA